MTMGYPNYIPYSKFTYVYHGAAIWWGLGYSRWFSGRKHEKTQIWAQKLGGFVHLDRKEACYKSVWTYFLHLFTPISINYLELSGFSPWKLHQYPQFAAHPLLWTMGEPWPCNLSQTDIGHFSQGKAWCTATMIGFGGTPWPQRHGCCCRYRLGKMIQGAGKILRDFIDLTI